MARRMGGQSGSVYLAGSTIKLADARMWNYEEEQKVLESSIKGEHFERYTPDVGTGRVRVQSFVPFPGAVTPLTRLMNESLVTPGGGGTPVDFALDMIDGNRIVTGQGYIVRAQLNVVRDGIITDEIEIQVDGQPTGVN